MTNLATTKMSSKGQVVIPEEIRTKLRLKPGTRFIAVGKGDVVIFKKIVSPSLEDFDELVVEARKQARKAGLTRSDITAAVREARGAR